MKRILLTITLLISVNTIFSQETDQDRLKRTEEAVDKLKEEKPNGWSKIGTFTLLANQASFTNWQAGGQSNI
jgi:hypothetical protein